ncbi:MAG: hypothetical protein RL150_397 [Candidatus Parcubacteria bacterium]|jgi:hypothetical protein
MRYHSAYSSERGFFKLIAIIIIAAAVLAFLGYNPKVLWDSYAVPAIIWAWNIIYAVIVFIIDLITSIVGVVKGSA